MLKPRVEMRVEDGVLVAEFWDCHRLDPEPVRVLRQQITLQVQNGIRPDLVVDLSGVGFAGSSALGGFVSIQRSCRADNGRVVFCNVEPNVREVFRVSSLENLFSFATDIPAAKAMLAGNVPPPAPTPPPDAASAPPPARGPLQRRRPGS